MTKLEHLLIFGSILFLLIIILLIVYIKNY
jgi:hypothetical protein